MKVDFLSCTKMLYLAEKVLQSNYYTIPGPEALVESTGLSEKELRELYDQFEHGNLFREEEITTEVEDRYGSLEQELSYDDLVADRAKITEFIAYTKKRYALREEPVITREAVVAIAEQIQKNIDKGKLIRAICSFSKTDTLGFQFERGEYSLADILFRHAYAEGWIKPFPFVLGAFLNPIYYGIENEGAATKIFDYIDNILSKTKNRSDYDAWLIEASKYIEIPNRIDESESEITIKRPHHFPYKLPAGTTWGNITIQFLDFTRVVILAGKHRHDTNYADMGFNDGRSNKPNQQWTFLRVLGQRGGEITWSDPKSASKWKKTKELLAKTLKEYFPIEYDPFLPYRLIDDTKKDRCYKIKINVIPDEELAERGPHGSKQGEKTIDEELGEMYEQ